MVTDLALVHPFVFPNPPNKFTEDELHRLLLFCSKVGASDLKIQTGNFVFARVQGLVRQLTNRRLPPPEVEMMLSILYGANGPARIKSGNPIDKAYELHPTRTERYRFRVNAVGGMSNGVKAIEVTIRMIVIEPPTMDQLGLEMGIRAGAFPKDGIFIMSGATGSGKSTTLAAIVRNMLEDVNGNRFIVTFEQPIEHVFDTIAKPSSVIFQTEIGDDADLKNFPEGIRSAMRRAPDVILTGEMRDPETVEATLAAAESGHAVYTTVHAKSVVHTFNRVVNFFPHNARGSILNGMLSSVRGICYQRLLRTLDDKRCALREYLIFTEDIREELLSIGADNMERMMLHMGKIVDRDGQSKRVCAQRLFDEGKISEHTLIAASAD